MQEEIRSKLIIFSFLFFITLNFLSWKFFFELLTKKNLQITFFDVGQGDAILIQIPFFQQILIDGGPSPNLILEKLAKEMPFGDRKIELLILTHPEKDHLFGVLEVLKRYKVEKILWTGIQKDTEEFLEWKRQLKKEKAQIFLAKSGQKILAKPALFLILNPKDKIEGKLFKNSNSTSIVLKLQLEKISFLFTGDIPQTVEKRLINENKNLKSTFLKVAHHGSKNSTSLEFLEVVLPKVALISVGKNNPYGHPDDEVLKRLRDLKIKVLRTDFEGDVRIITDGKRLYRF